MRDMCEIRDIVAREILDSRGFPSLEVEVHLSCGASGRSSVPSGASTGRHEAHELRDGDSRRYGGKGVLNARAAVEEEIRSVLLGMDARAQVRLDRMMIQLDGTANKSRLGANALLGVSLALARSAARAGGMSLYRYLGGARARVLPVPLVNVINGGAHADNDLDVQEFMIMPVGAGSFSEGLRWSAEIFHALGSGLRALGERTNVGDEGGYAPGFRSSRQALDVVCAAVEEAGLTVGREVGLALDVAASSFAEGSSYRLSGEGVTHDHEGMVDYLEDLCTSYGISVLEDPLAEDDTVGWRLITERLGDRVMLVGDDVFVTNVDRLRSGMADGIGNALLLKMNQTGTLTEALEAGRVAEGGGYGVVVSHRSGETEDTSIADLAVALGSCWIKTGSISRGERVAKYNRLLRIEEELGDQALYGKVDRV